MESIKTLRQSKLEIEMILKIANYKTYVYHSSDNLTAAASSRSLIGSRRRARSRRRLNGAYLALPLSLLRRSVPVVNHLQGKDRVEREARNEAVQNQLVVNLLERRKDARQGPGEVVEDLGHVSGSFVGACLRRDV